MPKSHRPYPPEYRQHILELVRSGRTPEELAREFEPSAQCIRDWVKAAERPEGVRSDGLTQTEHEELIRLRHEVKIGSDESRSWARTVLVRPWLSLLAYPADYPLCANFTRIGTSGPATLAVALLLRGSYNALQQPAARRR